MLTRSLRARRLGVASLGTTLAVAGLAFVAPSAQAANAPLQKGTVLVADYSQHRVVAVAPDNSQQLVGSGYSGPSGVSINQKTGDVYVADFNASTVWKVAPDGTKSSVASGLKDPEAVLAEADGSVVISDSDNQRIIRVSPSGTQTVLPFTGLGRPYGLAEDAQGDIYVADQTRSSVFELTPAGVQSTVGSGLSSPSDVALDSAGDLLVVDTGNSRVLSITPTGAQTTLPFTGLAQPFGVGVDANDNVYVANLSSTNTYKLTPGGQQSTIGTGVGGAGVDVVTRPGQQISFTSTAPTTAVAGDSYTVTATGGPSGKPVTFTADSTSFGVCTVTDNGDGTATVALTHAGSCLIDADQAGDADYNAAPQAQQTVVVGKRTQAITFTTTAPTGALVGDTYDVAATGGPSGKPVTFTADSISTGVCTVTDHSDGTATVALDHAGSCVVDADQAGDADDLAAPQAQQTATVGKLAQAITFTTTAPAGALPGDTYTVKATGGGSGNQVIFTVDAASAGVCTLTDNGDSTATVTLAHQGTCVIDADQAGDGDHTAALQTQQSVAIGQLAQAITFTSTAPTGALPGDTYEVAAIGGGSGNPVTFSVDGSSGTACTLTDHGDGTATVSLDHSGVCAIDADQAGDNDHSAAAGTQQLVGVGKLAQAVGFTSAAPGNALPGDTYSVTTSGGRPGHPVSLSVDPASTGLCTVADHGDGTAKVSLVHAGTCVIDANQAGDADHTDAPQVQQSVTVAKLRGVVTFAPNPVDARVGGTTTVTATGGGSSSPVVFAAGPKSGDRCTVTPAGSVTFVHRGKCVVVATQAGDADHEASRRDFLSFHIHRVVQLVHFTTKAPSHAVVGDKYRAKATAGPVSAPVRFKSYGACTVGKHGLVRFTHHGTCTVAAVQVGGLDVRPAKATQKIVVHKG